LSGKISVRLKHEKSPIRCQVPGEILEIGVWSMSKLNDEWIWSGTYHLRRNQASSATDEHKRDNGATGTENLLHRKKPPNKQRIRAELDARESLSSSPTQVKVLLIHAAIKNGHFKRKLRATASWRSKKPRFYAV